MTKLNQFVRLVIDEQSPDWHAQPEGLPVVTNAADWSSQAWPPPDRLYVAIPKQPSSPYHLKPLIFRPVQMAQLADWLRSQNKTLADHYLVHWYEQTRCSPMTDEQVRGSTHFARGALYGWRGEWTLDMQDPTYSVLPASTEGD